MVFIFPAVYNIFLVILYCNLQERVEVFFKWRLNKNWKKDENTAKGKLRQKEFLAPRFSIEPQVIQQKNKKKCVPATENIFAFNPNPDLNFLK